MATTFLVLVLYALVTARITRLITTDKITEPIRKRITDRFGTQHMLTFLVFCPWCMGFWVASALCVPAALVAGVPLWWAPGLALAASQVTGMLASWDSE